MAEELKTIREASLAIGSVRNEIRIYAGLAVVISAIVIGLIGWGFNAGFEKIDRLEEMTARIDVRLERMESTLAQIATDAAAIKSATQSASFLSPENYAPGAPEIQGVISPSNKGLSIVPAIGGDDSGPVPAN